MSDEYSYPSVSGRRRHGGLLAADFNQAANQMMSMMLIWTQYARVVPGDGVGLVLSLQRSS